MIVSKSNPSIDRIKELLEYDADTGIFNWKVSRGTAASGSVAGTVNMNGYICIGIDKRIHYGHKLAWAVHFGEFPKSQIDHINGIKTDNRMGNLRLATNAENHQNRKRHSNNKSGHPGVFFNKRLGKWTAQVTINYNIVYLGVFKTIDEAINARAIAKAKLHKFNPYDRPYCGPRP